MGGPKAPSAPPPPAPPPTETSADVVMAQDEMRKRSAGRTGRKSTILTDNVNEGGNTVLG